MEGKTSSIYVIWYYIIYSGVPGIKNTILYDISIYRNFPTRYPPLLSWTPGHGEQNEFDIYHSIWYIEITIWYDIPTHRNFPARYPTLLTWMPGDRRQNEFDIYYYDNIHREYSMVWHLDISKITVRYPTLLTWMPRDGGENALNTKTCRKYDIPIYIRCFFPIASTIHALLLQLPPFRRARSAGQSVLHRRYCDIWKVRHFDRETTRCYIQYPILPLTR